MYSVICVLFLTGFVFLTVLEGQGYRKWLTAAEGVLSGAGLLLHPVLLLLLRGGLAAQEEAFAAWAWDCMKTYLQYALPMLGIFCGITFFCALSPLWEKKYRTVQWSRVRAVSLTACAVVLLAFAGFFAAVSHTDGFPLAGCMQVLGLSGALVLRGMYLAEAVWKHRKQEQRSV